MKKYIKEFLELNCKTNKRFDLIALEKFIIDKCGGQSKFHELGGYNTFYKEMQNLKEEDLIKEINSSDSNRNKLPMKLRWTIISPTYKSSWKDEDIIRLSDRLNLKYYIKHPEYATEREWQHVSNVYNFLKEKESRQWASVEERCLELFDDEKFLTDNDGGKKDNKVLARLGLSLEDIKAKKYGEQFIYWNRGVSNIRTVIILENHSTFFSFKRAVQEGIKIFNVEPDALIFGYGKKIISSFSFIDEIADPHNLRVYYFGDMDPEGYSIYGALKDKYSTMDISLLTGAYAALIKLCRRKYHAKDQVKNRDHLDKVIKEFREADLGEYVKTLIGLWEENNRIPQELITYENLLRAEGAEKEYGFGTERP